jgi:hypothetical protein
MLKRVEILPRTQVSFLNQVVRPVLVRHLPGQAVNGGQTGYSRLLKLFCSLSPRQLHLAYLSPTELLTDARIDFIPTREDQMQFHGEAAAEADF